MLRRVMTSWDVAVVGAAAAGLAAAIQAGQTGARVLLLNAHPKVGLKILMSGGTRCNVTHRTVSERDYNGGSRAVVARTLRAFSAERTREWFASMGVTLRLESTGKYFPTTDDAHTVLDALLAEARRAGVRIESGWRVVRVTRDGDAFTLAMQPMANSNAFGPVLPKYGHVEWDLPDVHAARTERARAVVLATGGISFPRTGSDGTGYALARALGHTLVAPVPCLTPLTSDDALPRALQGLTLDLALTLWVDGARAVTTQGSCVFTHVGLSGPAALDISRHWLRADGARTRAITACFISGATEESLLGAWFEAPRVSVRRHLGEHVPDRLVLALCEESDVVPGTPLAQVRKDARTTLLRALVRRDMRITGTLGFEKAEATAGGVVLSEVDPSTLESRCTRGVFLCGEILDVDGRLGGFNFQWAWSSGAVAGAAAARSAGVTARD